MTPHESSSSTRSAKYMTKKHLGLTVLSVSALVVASFLFLAFYTRYLWEGADQNLRAELLDQARRVALAIHMREFMALSGTETDLASPEYLRLKSNLVLTRQSLPEIRFLYLMGRTEDGSIFFYVDSEPAGSEDESPPGQIYEEVSEPLINSFTKAQAAVEGPVTDRWGTWISALVPLRDPDRTEVIAVFGMDVEADRWNQLILNEILVPLSLAAFMTLFVCVSMIFFYYRGKVQVQQRETWFHRHAELCLTLVLGTLITGQLAWIVQDKERHARRETFARIADARTGYIATYLRDLEEYHLAGLAGFFEASQFVDPREFLTYVASLARDPKIQAWEWAPKVAGEDLPGVKKAARRDGLTDYMVWEFDEGGRKITVRDRETYHPVLYVSPLEGNEPALGFDLGSEPIRRAALETAAQTRLATATDPLTLVQEMEGQVGVRIFKPVWGNGEPLSQDGFVLAVIRMEDLLNGALGRRVGDEPLLFMDIYQLQAEGELVFLAGNSPDSYIQGHSQGQSHHHLHGDLTYNRPMYAFGKVYALVAHAGPAFAQLYPARAGWIAIVLGTIITGLAGAILTLYANRRHGLERLVAERTEELAKSERKYRTLAESTSAVLWEYDIARKRWTYISPQIAALTGWPGDAWTDPQFWMDHLHPGDRPWVSPYFSDFACREANPELEYRLLRPDGSLVWVRDVASVESIEGMAVRTRGFLIDITQKKLTEETLRLQSTALRSSANAIIITDRKGLIRWANPAFSRLTGYHKGEVLGKNPGELLNSGMHDPAFFQEMWCTILAGEIWSGEVVNRKKDGNLYHEEMTIAPVKTVADEITHFIAIKQDISERKQREQELVAIASISAALRAAASRTDMLPVILGHLRALFRVDGTALVFRGPAGGDLIAEAEGEFVNGFFRQHGPGLTISRAVIESGEPFVTRDISQAAEVCTATGFAAIRAAACVPLVVAEGAIGALWIGRGEALLPGDLRLLTSIADIAANAIHRETLRDETLKHLEQLTALRAIDQKLASSTVIGEVLKFILTQVADRLSVDAAAIHLYQPSSRGLEFACGHGFRTGEIETTSLPNGQGLLNRFLLEHKTLCLADLNGNEWTRNELMRQEGFASYYATPVVVQGEVKGLIEVFHRSRLELETMWIHFLEILAGQIAIALDNFRLLEGLRRSNIELKEAYEATIEGWSRAMDLRDKETEGHTQRVASLALELARLMGMSEEELVHVRHGALLHDIGKLGVPDSILHKCGPLDEAEWEVMRRHAQLAHDMLLPIPYLQPAIAIPYCHHEKWDGTGYPHGLQGEEIPLAARVFAVVDVFDALISDRPYRKAWSFDQALAYIREQSGKHFDPQVVVAFFSILDRT
jgi:PAS domain S-box-containing protein